MTSLGNIVEEDDTSGSGFTNTPGPSSDDGNPQAMQIAAKENKAVFRSKIFVVVFLLVTTATVAALTYYFKRQEETHTFEKEVSAAYAFYTRRYENYCSLTF